MAGKSETFIKLGLVFFISLLSFAIGTLVGKEYSDRQYKLSKLEPSEHGSGHGAREVASERPTSKLSDEEIAKLSEEFMTDDSVEQAKDAHGEHGKAPAIENKVAAHNEHNKDHEFDEMNDAALEAAQAIIDGKLPSAASDRRIANTEVKETKKPALPMTMPKNAAQETVGKWTLQVGAYAKEDEAKSRAESLKGKGYNAFYIPGTVDGKTWFRVNVGTYATIDEAKRANEKFTADNGGQKGFVKEIVK